LLAGEDAPDAARPFPSPYSARKIKLPSSPRGTPLNSITKKISGVEAIEMPGFHSYKFRLRLQRIRLAGLPFPIQELPMLQKMIFVPYWNSLQIKIRKC
jgi:hypothetical protein